MTRFKILSPDTERVRRTAERLSEAESLHAQVERLQVRELSLGGRHPATWELLTRFRKDLEDHQSVLYQELYSLTPEKVPT